MAIRPRQWRLLAVFCGPSIDSCFLGDDNGHGCIGEFLDPSGANAQVKILRDETLQRVCEEIRTWQPNLLYLSGGVAEAKRGAPQKSLQQLSFLTINGKGPSPAESSLAAAICEAGVDTVYFDALCSQHLAAAVRPPEEATGPAHVMHWRVEAGPSAIVASHFAHVFFATLRHLAATTPEAYAVAQSAVLACLPAPAAQAHAPAPAAPIFSSDFGPCPPDLESIPSPVVEGMDFSNGVESAVPGWEHVRLLAPDAELRVLHCGAASPSDAPRLSALCEGLRAVLAMEMRQIKVPTTEKCKRQPTGLPAGHIAVRSTVRTLQEVNTSVVLTGPADILSSPPLVEFALRQTLFIDALNMQIRLPAPGVPAPPARTSVAVAGGLPVVDALLSTTVWALHVLRMLAQEVSYRGLVSLGMGAVDGVAVAAFTKQDCARYKALVSETLSPSACERAALDDASAPIGPASVMTAYAPPIPPQPHMANGILTFSAGDVGISGRPLPQGPTGLLPFEPPRLVQPSLVRKWTSGRPPLRLCTEDEFLDDVHAFLSERKIRQVPPREAFPDAILNGSRLDVFSLYKEVCQRGGIKMGNGINWKGQIFSNMSNYTAVNKMTGVGNALKKHYHMYLTEYEKAHPEDVRTDLCAICKGGDEKATDWVGCDTCDNWVHLSCDTRPALGTFKDYATGEGRTYICPDCAHAKRARKE